MKKIALLKKNSSNTEDITIPSCLKFTTTSLLATSIGNQNHFINRFKYNLKTFC